MMRFVGVGPGDPELITQKAIRAIREADVLAVPDSGAEESAALRIARPWIQEGQTILHLAMPMQGGKMDWHSAHAQAAQTLLSHLRQGEQVAYLVLGDPSLYATSGYLMRYIAPHQPCEVIAGVPSVCAMAARLGVPLCEGRAPLHIHPGYTPGTPLPKGNVVVMKAGRSLAALQAAAGERAAYVVQNLGMPGERIGRLEDLPPEAFQEKQPYFTTVFMPNENIE